MSDNENEIVDRVERIVRQRMADQQAGHGVDHVMRVLKTARRIQAEVGGERLVIELAALLHDLGDAKFHQGVERSGEIAREILMDPNSVPADVETPVDLVTAESLAF